VRRAPAGTPAAAARSGASACSNTRSWPRPDWRPPAGAPARAAGAPRRDRRRARPRADAGHRDGDRPRHQGARDRRDWPGVGRMRLAGAGCAWPAEALGRKSRGALARLDLSRHGRPGHAPIRSGLPNRYYQAVAMLQLINWLVSVPSGPGALSGAKRRALAGHKALTLPVPRRSWSACATWACSSARAACTATCSESSRPCACRAPTLTSWSTRWTPRWASCEQVLDSSSFLGFPKGSWPTKLDPALARPVRGFPAGLPGRRAACADARCRPLGHDGCATAS